MRTSDLCQGIKWSLPSGWECRFVHIIVGTVSVGEEEWRRTMSVLDVAKAKGQHIRKELDASYLEIRFHVDR